MAKAASFRKNLMFMLANPSCVEIAITQLSKKPWRAEVLFGVLTARSNLKVKKKEKNFKAVGQRKKIMTFLDSKH